MWHVVTFIFGLWLLVKAADILIDGAASLARKLKISSWVVGVVVVGIGTSIPELSITVASALRGSEVGLGTILGGNIFNVLAILGLVAIIAPLRIDGSPSMRRDIFLHFAFSIFSAGIFFASFFTSGFAGLTRPEAGVLFGMFLIWIIFMLTRKTLSADDDLVNEDVFTITVSLAMVAAGALGVYLGGILVVNGAEYFARLFEINAALIGLTIVGIGTSIPELAVSTRAALKGEQHIAIGNIVGSNIFNLLGILGVAGLIRPIAFDSSQLYVDVIMVVVAAGLFWVLSLVGKEREISRGKGVIMILVFCLYLLQLIIRGPLY